MPDKPDVDWLLVVKSPALPVKTPVRCQAGEERDSNCHHRERPSNPEHHPHSLRALVDATGSKHDQPEQTQCRRVEPDGLEVEKKRRNRGRTSHRQNGQQRHAKHNQRARTDQHESNRDQPHDRHRIGLGSRIGRKDHPHPSRRRLTKHLEALIHITIAPRPGGAAHADYQHQQAERDSRQRAAAKDARTKRPQPPAENPDQQDHAKDLTPVHGGHQ